MSQTINAGQFVRIDAGPDKNKIGIVENVSNDYVFVRIERSKPYNKTDVHVVELKAILGLLNLNGSGRKEEKC